MLKFVLVAFLFMGLAVKGQASEEQNVMNFNEESHEADDERAVNSKAEDSSEESSEEEEQNDESGAVENFVSENENEEFDQNDDVGSKAMLEENENEEEDSSGWCGLSKCKSFQRMKSGFIRYRNICKRCLSRRSCKRTCTKFFNYRRRGYRSCLSRMKRIWAYYNRLLSANYKKFYKANKLMNIYYAKAKLFNRSCNYKSWKQIQKYKKTFMAKKARWARIFKYVNANMYKWLRIRNSWVRKWRRNRRSRYLFNKVRYSNGRYKTYMRKRNAALRQWRKYKRLVKMMNRWLDIKKAFFRFRRWANYQKKQRAKFLAQRKALFAARSKAMRAQRRRCVRWWYILRNRCANCHAKCGPSCWNMHVYYAHMVKQAHRCRIQKWFCRRKGVYRKYWGVYARQCNWCMKKFRKKRGVQLLLCASRCGAARKFMMLAKYYGSKC